MRVLYSPASTLLDFDNEVNVLSFSGFTYPHGKLSFLPGTPNMRNTRGRGQYTSSSTPASGGCGSWEDGQLAQFAPTPNSTIAGVHTVGTQAVDLTPVNPEHLASSQRHSTIAGTVNSLYAWADTGMLGPDAPQSLSRSPLMLPYYTCGPSRPSLSQSGHGVPGYTSHPIDGLYMERGFTGNPSLSANPYPAMSPMTYPSMETQPGVYSADEIHGPMTQAEQWHSQEASSSFLSTAPAEAFLSPRSVPAASIDSSSTMSTSPAPTMSDFESSSTLRPGPSSPSSNPADLTRYGIPAGDGVWRCAHPGCTSQALFRRGCDLRKHFNRHRKHLFCRHEGCPQSKQGGFSSKKDRARHEAKHNPGIACEWDGCARVFSRVDNMKDHVRRIHRRGGSR